MVNIKKNMMQFELEETLSNYEETNDDHALPNYKAIHENQIIDDSEQESEIREIHLIDLVTRKEMVEHLLANKIYLHSQSPNIESKRKLVETNNNMTIL